MYQHVKLDEIRSLFDLLVLLLLCYFVSNEGIVIAVMQGDMRL